MTHRPPASQAVAERLRHAVLSGELPPGTRLDEVSLGHELGVSRNTLREGFRLLEHEQLVEHVPNRGVFVRTIEAAEAHAIYAARRMLEVGALRDAALLPERVEQGLPAVAAAVRGAEEARERGDWTAVGTSNGDFHRALAALAGNPVVDRQVRTMMALQRLIFLSFGRPDAVHDAYVDENRRIYALIAAGAIPRAVIALETYLLRAERHIVGE